MIIKLFKSAKDLSGDKLRNPFFGTYILVWVIRNWELIYSLIYLDSEKNLTERLTYLKTYFEVKEFASDLLNNLWLTFLLLIISYLLLNLSRFIVNISELIIKPWIDKNVDSKSIVTKERFASMERQRNDLQNSIDSIRNSLSSSEVDVKDKLSEINTLKGSFSKANEELYNRERRIKTFQENEKNQQKIIEHNKTIDDKLRVLICFYLLEVNKNLGSEKMIEFSEFYDENIKSKSMKFKSKTSQKLFENRFLIEKNDYGIYVFTKLGHLLKDCIYLTGIKSITFNTNDGLKKHLEEVIIKKIE